MSNFFEALRSKLLSSEAITNKVANRVYYGKAPQSGLEPYIVFSLISASDFQTLNGNESVVVERYQIDVYSKDLSVAVSIRDAVHELLKYIQHQSFDSFKVYFCTRVNSIATIDSVSEGSEATYYRFIQDYQIKHNY